MLAKRMLNGTADRVEDPIDVYRIRLPKRSKARIRLRPSFGNPDLYVFGSSARSTSDSSKIITRSKHATKKTDSVKLTNRGGSARSFYVAIAVGNDAAGALNATYQLQFQRIKLR